MSKCYLSEWKDMPNSPHITSLFLERVHYHGWQMDRMERKATCKKEVMSTTCSRGEEYYRDDPICNLKPAEFSSSYPQLLSCLRRSINGLISTKSHLIETPRVKR